MNRGEPIAAGGVLAVDNDRIELEPGPQPRQLGQQDRPASAADHVADIKDTHVVAGSGSCQVMVRQPASVTTSCSGTSLASAGTDGISWQAKQ